MRPAVLALALAACALLAAPACAYRLSTYRVPVSQPDELGLPVTLDTDVYLPDAPPPPSGYPLIQVYHGGGSEKSNPYDSGHTKFFADHGYAAILYTQRGHGNSDGQTGIAGPKEMRDLFDVAHWALQRFPIDASRIALTGYSQGGLHTNLGQVWALDPAYNPYGISFKALEPGNTPDTILHALVPHGVVKLSFGAGILVQSYLLGTHGRVAPEIWKWTATTAADQPGLYGGAMCDATGHDEPTSSTASDWAFRSMGCFLGRMTPPLLWAQAFDDSLFPPELAIAMWRRLHRAHPEDRLYLSMGGHGAPAAADAVERDRLGEQLAFFDHALRGAPLDAPPVVYWTRDPAITVPADSYAWPAGAWYRQSAAAWPPRGTQRVTYQLGADGSAVAHNAQAGSLPLAPISEDERNDSVAAAVVASTPLGTSPIPRDLPATSTPGFVAAFRTAPSHAARELSGAPVARLAWTPGSPDTQLIVQVFDEAPDGTLTLLTRGVQGVRGAAPGTQLYVTVTTSDTSVLIRSGHRLVAWVMAGDLGIYKPFAGSAGGLLAAGSSSRLTLPLR
jgi:predicted acyl esterase